MSFILVIPKLFMFLCSSKMHEFNIRLLKEIIYLFTCISTHVLLPLIAESFDQCEWPEVGCVCRVPRFTTSRGGLAMSL